MGCTIHSVSPGLPRDFFPVGPVKPPEEGTQEAYLYLWGWEHRTTGKYKALNFGSVWSGTTSTLLLMQPLSPHQDLHGFLWTSGNYLQPVHHQVLTPQRNDISHPKDQSVVPWGHRASGPPPFACCPVCRSITSPLLISRSRSSMFLWAVSSQSPMGQSPATRPGSTLPGRSGSRESPGVSFFLLRCCSFVSSVSLGSCEWLQVWPLPWDQFALADSSRDSLDQRDTRDSKTCPLCGSVNSLGGKSHTFFFNFHWEIKNHVCAQCSAWW